LVKVIAVVALTLSLGLHWAFLQSVAWAGMIVQYSKDDSVTSALSKTFDGKHACKLCRIVEAGRSAEKAPAIEVKVPKLAACSPVVLTVWLAENPIQRLPERGPAELTARFEAPPLPPPRQA
jgi:hypothetical protein